MPRAEVGTYPWGSETVFAAELDGDGLILRANPALEQVAGELEGVPFAHLIVPEQQAAFERRLAALADGESLSGTFAFADPSGGLGVEDRLVWLTLGDAGTVELIAEPAWGERDRLVEQVLQLNDDLISTQRVAARRQRDLEVAQHEADRSASRIRRLEAILLAGLTPGDFEAALHRLLGAAQDLLPGDRSDILLLDESASQLLLRASAGRDASPERYGQPVDIGEGLLAGIARSEAGVLIEDLREASRLGVPARQGSLIGVPLRLEGQVIGVLVASAVQARAFNGDDLRVLELVGERIALSIGQAQMREREQHLAETLQRTLLPQGLPRLDGLQLCARYLPHTSGVGGDFYDALVLEDGVLGLAIGDVTGKGLRAAAAMGRLRSALHAYAIDSGEPAEVLERLGRLAQVDDAMATALYLTMRPSTGEIRLASAGHLPPLYISPPGAGGAGYVNMRSALTPPLGLGIAHRRQMTLTLSPGSTLVLYTDGIVERTRNIDEGMAALADAATALAHADPDALCDGLIEQLAPGGRYRDDVAVIALRRL